MNKVILFGLIGAMGFGLTACNDPVETTIGYIPERPTITTTEATEAINFEDPHAEDALMAASQEFNKDFVLVKEKLESSGREWIMMSSDGTVKATAKWKTSWRYFLFSDERFKISALADPSCYVYIDMSDMDADQAFENILNMGKMTTEENFEEYGRRFIYSDRVLSVGKPDQNYWSFQLSDGDRISFVSKGSVMDVAVIFSDTSKMEEVYEKLFQYYKTLGTDVLVDNRETENDRPSKYTTKVAWDGYGELTVAVRDTGAGYVLAATIPLTYET